MFRTHSQCWVWHHALILVVVARWQEYIGKYLELPGQLIFPTKESSSTMWNSASKCWKATEEWYIKLSSYLDIHVHRHVPEHAWCIHEHIQKISKFKINSSLVFQTWYYNTVTIYINIILKIQLKYQCKNT